MIESRWLRLLKVVLGLICLAILGGILFAGLYPFTAHPNNDVTWLQNGSGLRLGKNASIFSSATLAGAALPDESCSIEIWARPESSPGAGTLAAFYTPPDRIEIRQGTGTDLFIWRSFTDDRDRVKTHEIYVDHGLVPGRDAIVTVTSDGRAAAVYVNGVLARRDANFGLTAAELKGQLILGGSPHDDESWSGELRGFAVYGKEMSAAEVAEHNAAWTTKQTTGAAPVLGAALLYRFDEGVGRAVHNRGSAGPDLFIPEDFRVSHEVFLERPWNEFHANWGYFKDVAINVTGFIPFGFCFCAYFALWRLQRPALRAILLGAAVSITIEFLQAYIPTRDSGMTDILTNTTGTVLGAALCTVVTRIFVGRSVGNQSQGESGLERHDAPSGASNSL